MIKTMTMTIQNCEINGTNKSEIFSIKLPSICKHNSPCRHVKTQSECFRSKQGLTKEKTLK